MIRYQHVKERLFLNLMIPHAKKMTYYTRVKTSLLSSQQYPCISYGLDGVIPDKRASTPARDR